ncbi:hypothetical protein FEK35_04705 [Nocardia cyriacigeorgica]|uniref:Uncharacterized protein n=1 Tax=Nocardia cyriacigeorgica TaxID=135487 RepID=A0A5R8PJC3_9NOCA|nr:hypothetical protein FEK35_04705 [Nocardia cyriacigeorgica]
MRSRRTARPATPTAADPTAACARFGHHWRRASRRRTIGPARRCVRRYCRPRGYGWPCRWPRRYRRPTPCRRAVVRPRPAAGQGESMVRMRSHREVSWLNCGVPGSRRTAPIHRLWTTPTDVDKPSFTRAISMVVIHAVD